MCKNIALEISNIQNSKFQPASYFSRRKFVQNVALIVTPPPSFHTSNNSYLCRTAVPPFPTECRKHKPRHPAAAARLHSATRPWAPHLYNKIAAFWHLHCQRRLRRDFYSDNVYRQKPAKTFGVFCAPGTNVCVFPHRKMGFKKKKKKFLQR